MEHNNNCNGNNENGAKERELMKYSPDLYINSGFYSEEEEDDIEHYTEKVVKCRKPHKCSGCDKTIEAGDEALRETGFMDGKPVSNYVCLPCIEAWLVESYQVEPPEQEV